MKVGDLVEAEIGPVAHGGHMVARVDGRVVFVRHALPGERVRVRITEDSGSFLRGDAVEVLVASSDRVEAPCALARPDGCGGCDFQHVSLPAQRRLKAAVVREQLQRLAGLERDVVVEEVPPTLGWRTRMQYVHTPTGARGLRRYRSHDVIEVDHCLIAAPDAREPGPGVVVEEVLGHEFKVAADGFWQVHPAAPRVLVETVLSMLDPRPGERTLDLYGGVGLFSVFLAEAVGSSGEVTLVEGDSRAVRHAAANLSAYGWAQAVRGRVDRVLARSPHLAEGPGIDLVVLDPPRAGAKRAVVESVAALEPRAVAYVACDPAALARDLAYFAPAGYQLRDLRAFDLFPMTHHVECVALMSRDIGDGSVSGLW